LIRIQQYIGIILCPDQSGSRKNKTKQNNQSALAVPALKESSSTPARKVLGLELQDGKKTSLYPFSFLHSGAMQTNIFWDICAKEETSSTSSDGT